MDMFSSNEDLITKTRKPYTITKQRERWTAEEHTRFLEAIKLYGRAWQRIEEHIGTKTAVQIRSHAQKFFSKLEKEALIKGAPLGQARDIDIPPPRPKRKPNNPYPRKSSASTPNSICAEVKDGSLIQSASSLHSGELTQDLENDLHLEKPCKRTREKEDFEEDNMSGILTLSQETPCTWLSPGSTSPPASAVFQNQCVFKDLIPSVKEISDEGVMNDSSLNRTDAHCTELYDGTSKSPNLNNCCHNMDFEVIEGVKLKQPKNLCLLPKEEIQSNQNYPRHIPVHVLESSSETCTESPAHATTCPASVIHKVKGAFRTVNNFTNQPASATTENHSNVSVQQSLPNFPSPLNPLSNNDDSCNMFVNTTFSNLIVSTLLQNPAAHAAASFAAAFWPVTNVKTPVDSPLGNIEGFQLRHGGLSPSASAIAAATVMAASAWWAAHGLLPLCPLNAGFAFSSAPINPSPADASPVLVEKEKKDQRFKASPGEGQLLDTGLSKNLEPKLLDTKLADYDKNGTGKSNNTELETPGHEQKPTSITGLQDKGKPKEQVDRSSCGSNTPSSSEVEMDMLEKHGNGNDESKEHNAHRTGEASNHRGRSTGNLNDSWREVSEEGKLAFKALFSRGILPQSFTPPKCVGKNEGEVIHKSDEDKLELDLNSETSVECQETEKAELVSIEKGVLLMGCAHEKLKDRRAGFKPYKRCLVEGKVMSASNQGEERDPKRVCVGGEALT